MRLRDQRRRAARCRLDERHVAGVQGRRGPVERDLQLSLQDEQDFLATGAVRDSAQAGRDGQLPGAELAAAFRRADVGQEAALVGLKGLKGLEASAG